MFVVRSKDKRSFEKQDDIFDIEQVKKRSHNSITKQITHVNTVYFGH